jgi:hypothetical protein
MTRVRFLKNGEFVSAKEFNTPIAAFVYALEEAENLYGPASKKEMGGRTFHYKEERDGDGVIVVVDPRWCGSPLRESDENEWMTIDRACCRHGSFSSGALRAGLDSGRWKNLTEGVEYTITENGKRRRIAVCYPLIFEAIGNCTPRVHHKIPNDLAERYEKAGSVSKLAEETGVSPNAIRKRLRSLNIDTSRKPSVCR